MEIEVVLSLWYTGLVEEYKRKPNTTCLVCQSPIYRRPSQIEMNKGNTFCGKRCYGIFNRKEKPCVVCGKMILSSLNKKTCSRICSNKNRAGIKYKIGRPRDKAYSLRAIKLRLFDARGKICERCRYAKYEILQVHHKNRDRQDNSLENLEIICPNCHYSEHLYEKSWINKNIEK